MSHKGQEQGFFVRCKIRSSGAGPCECRGGRAMAASRDAIDTAAVFWPHVLAAPRRGTTFARPHLSDTQTVLTRRGVEKAWKQSGT